MGRGGWWGGFKERGVGGREEGGVWVEERVIGRNGGERGGWERGERGGVWREGVSQPE